MAVRGDNAVDEIFAYTGTSENTRNARSDLRRDNELHLQQCVRGELGREGGAADLLTVTNVNAQILPGFPPGSGTVNTFTAGGASLLGASYSDFETMAVAATTVVIDGTSGDDTITVSALGIVTVTNTLGFNNTVDVSAATTLVLNTLSGNDSVTINSSGLFAGGIQVIGGEPGQGSDTLTIQSAASLFATLNMGPVVDSIFAVVGGPIAITGVETLNLVSTVDGNTDFPFITGYGDPTDLRTINVDTGDAAQDDGDLLFVLNSGLTREESFTPLSPSSAMLTNSNGPQINIAGFNNGPGSLLLLGNGSEEVTFNGSTAADTITSIPGSVTLTPTAGPPAFVPLSFGVIGSLVINGNAGSDLIQR